MKVKRIIKTNVNSFRVGDIIKFKLTDGEKVQAIAVQQENDGMLFCLMNCLADEYFMNDTNTNVGGYEDSDLRKKLNTEIITRFPADIKAMMVPFGNGDYLRLPTEKEIFGENYYGDFESPYVRQWKPMKQRRNRIAFQGENGGWEWYWHQNKCRDSTVYFTIANSNGDINYTGAYVPNGVRPVFKLKKGTADANVYGIQELQWLWGDKIAEGKFE